MCMRCMSDMSVMAFGLNIVNGLTVASYYH